MGEKFIPRLDDHDDSSSYESSGPDDRRIRRRQVKLPSGMLLEVIDELSNKDEKSLEITPVKSEGPTRLHICPKPECNGVFVYHQAKKEVDNGKWHLWLRCPDCEYCYDDVFDEESMYALYDEMDRGFESSLTELNAFALSLVQADTERLIKNINDGQILPEDIASTKRKPWNDIVRSIRREIITYRPSNSID